MHIRCMRIKNGRRLDMEVLRLITVQKRVGSHSSRFISSEENRRIFPFDGGARFEVYSPWGGMEAIKRFRHVRYTLQVYVMGKLPYFEWSFVLIS